MERLFVNSVGLLVQTKRGNIAILVILDAFSKFVSFCPVRKISSQVLVDCLERAFFPAYSTHSSIMTDNARVFCGKQFRDLCFRWGIDHITTPYYPQASLAERGNCNLKSALKIFHHESQMTWDVDLPWMSMAFNTTIHESTKCMPDKLFLGREMRSPLEVRWDLSPKNTGNIEDPNQSSWTQAHRNLKLASKRVAKRYVMNRKPHQYKVGDLVVYRLNLASSKTQNISAKFLLRWSKPTVIVKIVRPKVVLLANPDTGVVIRRAHVSQLKKYVK